MIDEPRAAVLTKLTAARLPQAVALSSEMGWPYRLEDWVFAHRLGEGLALEQGDQLIGTAMRWDYGDAFASVGMIIIAKAFQGHGYGARLVDALLDGAGSRSVFLNSTPEALELYRRRGFACTAELNQHQGVPVSGSQVPGGAGLQGARVRSAEASDLPQIIKLDEDSLGMPRIELLKSLAEVGRLTVISEGDVVSGYAASRAFGRGHVIGPVIAPNIDDACILIESTMSQLPAGLVRVDTYSSSGLSPWLEARGLQRVDTATSMIRGTSPQTTGQTRVFALCSQSLG